MSINNKEINSSNILVKFVNYLSTYEKIYLFCALVLSSAFAIIFPEEDVNGVHGAIIMTLLLMYTWANVVCELLISKQDKWNFMVSLVVEASEIAMYWILGYRFATMAVTIIFWVPIDIISFVAWKKHPDRVEKEKTEVRELKGWVRIAVIVGIIVWTAGIGSLIVHFTDALAETTDIFDASQRNLAILVCYLDAMVSALDICNGTFILLRLKEQWLAWYLEVIFDAICVVIGGQYVLLALTLCYLTNTTYGFIKWDKYIKAQDEACSHRKSKEL